MEFFNQEPAQLPLIGVDFVFENMKFAQLPLMKVMLFDAAVHTSLGQASWNIDSYDETLVLEARHAPVFIPGHLLMPLLHMTFEKSQIIVVQFNRIYGTNVNCTNVELDLATRFPAPFASKHSKEA